MLNQLIESREHHQESARRGKFLFSTMVITVLFCFSGLLWSLFARDLGIGNQEFELSRLVTPVVESAQEPPIIEEIRENPEPPQNSATKQINISTRKVIMAATNESQFAPKEISTAPVNQLSRPKGAVMLGTVDTQATFGNPQAVNRGGNSGGQSISSNSGIKTAVVHNDTEKEEPAPSLKKPAPPAEISKPKRPVSIGVVNGKAISLPKPPYTTAAQTIRAGGDVNVEVVIDETGKVISARAISGHPILKGISEAAARKATFEPTYLSKVPVKVTGIIVYKFTMTQ